MKTIALLFSIILFASTSTIACSCFGPTDFCATINPQNHDLIIKAVKVSQVFHGMEVKILEFLSEAEGVSDTIIVWGDDGALCRVYTDLFNASDTLILALHNTDLAHNFWSGDSIEQLGDYHLSVCGTYYLNVVNDTVTGHIYDNIDQQMAYNDFRTNMCKAASINAMPQQTPVITIYPNPSSGQTTIAIKNKKNEPIRLSLYTITGEVIQQIETTKDRIVIEKGDLPSGVYLYQVNYRNGQLLGEGKLVKD